MPIPLATEAVYTFLLDLLEITDKYLSNNRFCLPRHNCDLSVIFPLLQSSCGYYLTVWHHHKNFCFIAKVLFDQKKKKKIKKKIIIKDNLLPTFDRWKLCGNL